MAVRPRSRADRAGVQVRDIVRTVNEFRSVEEIADLAIVRRGGATVRLSDLSEVTAGNKKREVVTRSAGEESVELAMYREAGANIIDVAERVKAVSNLKNLVEFVGVVFVRRQIALSHYLMGTIFLINTCIAIKRVETNDVPGMVK